MLADWLTGWLACWLASLLAGLLAGWLAGGWLGPGLGPAGTSGATCLAPGKLHFLPKPIEKLALQSRSHLFSGGLGNGCDLLCAMQVAPFSGRQYFRPILSGQAAQADLGRPEALN